MTEIKNCLITKSDAKVLREYCIDTSSPLYRQYKGFNTSINLSATNVYSMYAGVVVMIPGDARNGYEVVVQINASQAIKYGNLKSVNVKQGQHVDVSQKIGVAKAAVTVEYLTTQVKNPYSFRLGNIHMYKDDPAKIINPEDSVIKNIGNQYFESGLQDFQDEFNGGVSPDMEFMLSGNG